MRIGVGFSAATGLEVLSFPLRHVSDMVSPVICVNLGSVVRFPKGVWRVFDERGMISSDRFFSITQLRRAR